VGVRHQAAAIRRGPNWSLPTEASHCSRLAIRARRVICCQDSSQAEVKGTRFAAPMSKSRRNTASLPLYDGIFSAKPRKPVPFEFVLDALAPRSPTTRPMFGCLAVYVADKIVLVLRDKRDGTADNGIWLATTAAHHQSLRQEFPNMRSIGLLRSEVTGWQVLPADAEDFEEAALRACELILAGDPRIGKVPGEQRSSKSGAKKAARSSKRTP